MNSIEIKGLPVPNRVRYPRALARSAWSNLPLTKGVLQVFALGLALSSAGCGEEESNLQELADEALNEEDSAYEELVEGIEEMDANDGRDHLDQRAIARWAVDGSEEDKLEFLFDHGDELTELQFTAADGIGSLVTFSRFSRYPTEGLFTGPNASSCGSCHDQPLGNGAGLNVANVVQDPEPGVEGTFNVRNTRNMNGDAWLQLAGAEMTVDLQAQRRDLKANAERAGGARVSAPLETKGVSFGSLTCWLESTLTPAAVQCDYAAVDGVSIDLVVRAGGWKGNHPTLRSFSEDAFFGEMGIHSDRFAYHVEQAGQTLPDDIHMAPPDVDKDGVDHEMSVGDVTSMAIYLAAQAPPTTLLELASEGKLRLSPEQEDRINGGEAAFAQVGCDSCHLLSVRVNDSWYREPDARHFAYHDYLLAQTNNGYDLEDPITMNLATDEVVERHLPATELDGERFFEVKAMTDLKRHFLGDHMCDESKAYTPVDGSHMPARVPADSADRTVSMAIDRCQFMTADLWGIGGTAPYMHDGRATTLREAIRSHCSSGAREGQANQSCLAFDALSAQDQDGLIAFLRNQVMEPEPE